jgi:hypothetical protein
MGGGDAYGLVIPVDSRYVVDMPVPGPLDQPSGQENARIVDRSREQNPR